MPTPLYLDSELSTYTATISNNKYHKDDTINEFLEFIRYTEDEKDAINNISVLLKDYMELHNKRLSLWQKILLLLK